MHPRERVLGLAQLIRQQGKPYPTPLIHEAERLDVTLPPALEENTPNPQRNLKANLGKESNNDETTTTETKES